MKAWILKSDMLTAAKSIRIKTWINTLGYRMSGYIRGYDLLAKPGYERVFFYPPKPHTKFTLQIPINKILVDHRLFNYSVPLSLISDIEELMAQVKDEKNRIECSGPYDLRKFISPPGAIK